MDDRLGKRNPHAEALRVATISGGASVASTASSGDDANYVHISLPRTITASHLWNASQTFAAGASFGGNITLTGDSDITLGTEVQILDHGGHGHIVVNTGGAVDEQFDIDAGGNIRAQGYFVGKHALQLPGALMICHFDGQQPYNTDFTGDPTGHMGQVATIGGGVIYRPGKVGKAVQLAEATTNLVSNPSFEVDLSGWTTIGGSRVTSGGRYGNAYLSAGTVTYSGVTISNSTAYTLSFYHRGSYSINIDFGNGTLNYFSASGLNVENDGWGRSSFSFTSNGTAFVIYLYTYSYDAVQLEQNPYATPYCDGSLGTGHSWSGTAHASTSSRTAGSATWASQRIPRSGSISMWVNSAAAMSQNANIRWLADGGYTSGIVLYVTDTDALGVWCGGAFRTSYTLTDGNFAHNTWHHVVATWSESAAETKLYLDGVQVGSTGGYAAPTDDAGGWDIGHFGGSYQWPGWIDDFALLDRAMSASEVRAVYESDAPVFAETSTWQWRAGNNLAWADAEGLWVLDASGVTALGVSGVNGKSWGGFTLNQGDILLGSHTPGRAAILWDISEGTFGFYGGTEAAVQVQIGTDGALYAGAGKISISKSGIFVYDGTPAAAFAISAINGSSWGGLTLDQGDVLMGKSTSYAKWDASAATLEIKGTIKADAGSIDGVLNIGTSGGIYQGSGTFASPTTGLKIWNGSGIGRIGGYNSGTLQWYADTDGKLYAGGGKIVMGADGLDVYEPSSFYNFVFHYTGVSNVGFMNFQQYDVNSNARGTMNMGWYKDTNNQSAVYAFEDELLLLVKKSGTWRYLFSAHYDAVTVESVPFNVAQLSADPTTGVINGSIYYNTSTNTFRVRENGAWRTM